MDTIDLFLRTPWSPWPSHFSFDWSRPWPLLLFSLSLYISLLTLFVCVFFDLRSDFEPISARSEFNCQNASAFYEYCSHSYQNVFDLLRLRRVQCDCTSRWHNRASWTSDVRQRIRWPNTLQKTLFDWNEHRWSCSFSLSLSLSFIFIFEDRMDLIGQMTSIGWNEEKSIGTKEKFYRYSCKCWTGEVLEEQLLVSADESEFVFHSASNIDTRWPAPMTTKLPSHLSNRRKYSTGERRD